MWQWYQMCNNLLGFCLSTEMSLRYLRLFALVLLPRDLFGSLSSVVSQWLLPNSPIGSAFLSRDSTQSSKMGWPQILSSLFFQDSSSRCGWGTQCGLYWSSSLSPVCHYPLPRALQSVPQHACLLRSENNVNYLANTQPICTIPSCSRHYLAPQTALLKFSLKLTVFPWHIAVKFPTVASRCWERDTDPAFIPTQYVCTSLLASGNYGDAARLTHHTELVSMWVCSHDSAA